MRNERFVGALYVAVSASAFGAMAIFARYAYGSGAEVVAVLFLRFFIAALLMSAGADVASASLAYPLAFSLVELSIPRFIREETDRLVRDVRETYAPMPGTEIRSFTVIGVMPPDFRFPNWKGNICNFWRGRDLGNERFAGPFDRHMRNWALLARLQPEVAATQAEA